MVGVKLVPFPRDKAPINAL
jgi:hypothetical protein